MKKINIFTFIIIWLNFFISPINAAGVNGDAQISGMFDGSPIVIKTTDRLAGAIDSLTWKGKEFVDSYDHGRQIQTAWTVNNYGQCYNPTEAGSSSDGTGPLSSSILLDINKSSSNSYYTKSKPAFWDPPGFQDTGCNFSLNGTNGPWLGGIAVNKTIVSDWLLEKWVTIGYEDIPNVIKYVSKITVPTKLDVTIDYIVLEQPAGLLPGDFLIWKQYNPSNFLLVEPTSFQGISKYPHVLITQNGNYAFSVYSPEVSEQGLENLPQYPYVGYQARFLPQFNLSGNGVRIAKTEPFTTGSIHTYVSYIVIGNPEQVRQSLKKLYSFNLTSLISSDIDRNGKIDIFDFGLLVQNFNRTTEQGYVPAGVNPDVDGNGKVDIFDFGLLVQNFGKVK